MKKILFSFLIFAGLVFYYLFLSTWVIIPIIDPLISIITFQFIMYLILLIPLIVIIFLLGRYYKSDKEKFSILFWPSAVFYILFFSGGLVLLVSFFINPFEVGPIEMIPVN